MPIRRRRRPVDLPGRPAPESAGRPASLGSGATSIELIAEEEEELPPAPREPELLEVVARFSTASAALSFAEQVTDGIALDSLPIARRADDHAWWIRSTLTLDSAREIAGLCAGELYLPRGDELVRDLGWGDSAGPGPSLALIDLAPVSLLELVRTAGLHPAPARPLWEIVVLMPGHLVTGLVRRALDIGLTATYQRVRLVPLFDAGGPAQVAYAVRLRADPKAAALPRSLLANLQDDPFALVCRSAAGALLIRCETVSPLSDRALAALVAAAGDDTWVLTDSPNGCARLSWLGEPLDAANLVQAGPEHCLTDLNDAQPWAEPPDQAGRPEPPTLTLVRTTIRSAPVDAVLLDDLELDCLAPLLAGESLADLAFLVRGEAGRHLLSAPGGLLADLPVGEGLTCIGPGSLYLPIGYRTEPPLPPSARGTLFPTDASTAKVILSTSLLAYDLDARQPVWRLWAGPIPDIDVRLSRTAIADIEQAADEIGHAPEPAGKGRLPRQLTRSRPPAESSPDAWRQQAYRAELERDFVAAAQLFARHNDPLRAARLYERQAQESP